MTDSRRSIAIERGEATLRIATWNVERPRLAGWKIPPARQRRFAEVDADVWILTETVEQLSPGEGFDGVFSPPYPERRPPHERWVGIWSRFPITPLDSPRTSRRGTVAASIDSPLFPLIVYGTVIPWAHERTFDDGTKASMWQVHLAEIDRQGAEWRELRTAYPDAVLVVGGDFNQDRDGSDWYGTAATRDALSRQLDQAELRCVTDTDVVRAGLLDRHHLIDHICVSAAAPVRTEIRCWEPRDEAGIRLSDHPTVAVDCWRSQTSADRRPRTGR